MSTLNQTTFLRELLKNLLRTEGIPGSFCPQQISNPANPQTYYKTIGPEIWDQMDGKVNIFVAGAGGTFMGTAKFLKEKK